jgi:hypothetical protein
MGLPFAWWVVLRSMLALSTTFCAAEKSGRSTIVAFVMKGAVIV